MKDFEAFIHGVAWHLLGPSYCFIYISALTFVLQFRLQHRPTPIFVHNCSIRVSEADMRRYSTQYEELWHYNQTHQFP